MNYVIQILKDKLAEIERDLPFIPNVVLTQRRKQLSVAIKVFTDGRGYIGPCEHNDGLKFIRFNDADAE